MKTKKTIATICAFALSIGLVSTYHVAEARAQIYGGTFLSINDVASRLNTPEAVASFMWRNFLFEHDQSNLGKEEYWQSPQEFMKNQRGDCEDFAIFAKEILRRNGIKAFLLNIYSSRYAHTICVFIENGKYNAIDMTDVRRYEANTLEALMTKIHPNWESGAVVMPSPTSDGGRIVRKITRK